MRWEIKVIAEKRKKKPLKRNISNMKKTEIEKQWKLKESEKKSKYCKNRDGEVLRRLECKPKKNVQIEQPKRERELETDFLKESEWEKIQITKKSPESLERERERQQRLWGWKSILMKIGKNV